jgi:hypothetical protein
VGVVSFGIYKCEKEQIFFYQTSVDIYSGISLNPIAVTNVIFALSFLSYDFFFGYLSYDRKE